MLMSYAYPKMAPAPTMPPGLVELMEDLTKEVLRNNPTDVYDFCAHHMQKLVEIRDGRPKKKPMTLEQRISRAQNNIRKKIEQRYLKLFDENLEPSDIQQDLSKSLASKGIKVPVHQDKSLQGGGEIELFPKGTGEHVDMELLKITLKNVDEPKLPICPENDFTVNEKGASKTDQDVENIDPTYTGIAFTEHVKDSDEIINNMTKVIDQSKNDDLLVKKPIDINETLPTDNDQIEDTKDSDKNHDHSKQIEIINEPLNAYFTETAITPDFKDSDGDININNHLPSDDVLHTSSASLLNESFDNNTDNETKTIISNSSANMAVSSKNTEEKIEPTVHEVKLEDRFEETILQGEKMSLVDSVVSDKSEELVTDVRPDSALSVKTESKPLETQSHNGVEENNKSKVNSNLDNDHEVINEPVEALPKPDDICTNIEDCKKTEKEPNEKSHSEDNNEYIKLNEDLKVEENNELCDHNDTNASMKENPEPCEISASDNHGIEILPSSPGKANTYIEEKEPEIELKTAQLEDMTKNSKMVSDVKTNDEQFVKDDTDLKEKIPTHSEIIEISTNKNHDEVKEYNVLKDDKSDIGSTISDNSGTNATMDLETAAVTIQKVFRNFLFKSRASTFDDAASDESNTLEKDFKDGDFLTLNQPVKDRRPPGLGRMDTVLQTVNEEKSLSLSTDDSSTISSAATIIQAHVRGFLARNKWNSSKTASLNSLQNSNPMSTENLEQQNKSKTVLNIHIVPENGHFISRDDSVLVSMDLSLDGSPPTSTNLHPLSHDVSERRKLLRREDAIQSISPPSNNSGKLSEDAESVKEVPLNEINTSNDLMITDEHDLEANTNEYQSVKATKNNSLDEILHADIENVTKDSSDETLTFDNTNKQPCKENLSSDVKDGDGSKSYNSDHNTDELGPFEQDTLENKSDNQSNETTPTSSLTSDTVIEVKKENNEIMENQVTPSNAAPQNKNDQFVKDGAKGYATEILNKDDAHQTTSFDLIGPKQETGENSPNIRNKELILTTSLTPETVNEVRKYISDTNDAGDVITPLKDKTNEIPLDSVEPKLLHSGEFHDVVLPTKVSRNETSVIREFKNVVVYFLLWNNA